MIDKACSRFHTHNLSKVSQLSHGDVCFERCGCGLKAGNLRNQWLGEQTDLGCTFGFRAVHRSLWTGYAISRVVVSPSQQPAFGPLSRQPGRVSRRGLHSIRLFSSSIQDIETIKVEHLVHAITFFPS